MCEQVNVSLSLSLSHSILRNIDVLDGREIDRLLRYLEGGGERTKYYADAAAAAVMSVCASCCSPHDHEFLVVWPSHPPPDPEPDDPTPSILLELNCELN